MSSNRTVSLRAAVISAGIVISAVDLVGPVTDGTQGVLVPAHSTVQYSTVHYSTGTVMLPAHPHCIASLGKLC